MESGKIVQRGAEAVLLLKKHEGQKVLVKDRIRKGYRIPELDKRVRSQRTKREAKLLGMARRVGVNTPRILDLKESSIVMEWVKGKRVKDCLNEMPKKERLGAYRLMGETIGRLHEGGVIHGDLTTSNMIIKDRELFLIDFGLGKNSKKIEDQAVDLYVLYEAVRSTHFVWLEEAWTNVLKAYKQKYSNAQQVLERVKKIEVRRRYKS